VRAASGAFARCRDIRIQRCRRCVYPEIPIGVVVKAETESELLDILYRRILFRLWVRVYFFLFNLYLLDLHFNERTIGLVGGALTFGSVIGTLRPAGLHARPACAP